jgi:hypothetical protein
VLQGLGRLLMEREVVDREALQQLLQPATAAAGATPAAA